MSFPMCGKSKWTIWEPLKALFKKYVFKIKTNKEVERKINNINWMVSTRKIFFKNPSFIVKV